MAKRESAVGENLALIKRNCEILAKYIDSSEDLIDYFEAEMQKCKSFGGSFRNICIYNSMSDNTEK